MDVAVVLLAGRHDQRRAVGASVGEVADGVADTGRRVEVDEGGAARGLRVTVGHADGGRFLQREHVVDVLDAGQRVHERKLGRARVAEDVPDGFRAQDFEEDVAAGARHGRHGTRSVCGAPHGHGLLPSYRRHLCQTKN